MYLTNSNVTPSARTVVTLEMHDGHLGTRRNLCGTESYYSESSSLINEGWLNFIQLRMDATSLLLMVNGSVGVNETIQTTSCPLQADAIHFGKVPETLSGRRRRQAAPTSRPLSQLEPFNGVLQDIELQDRKLDFEVRQGAQETYTIIMSDQVNVTLGAESTISVCSTGTPCENGGTCSDVFFNDFQ